jgi:hypothetical protein
MFSNYLSGIKGVEIYPLFSLVVFFAFFIVVGFKVIKADKDYLRKMENLPLEDGDITSADNMEINRRSGQ